MVDKRKSPRANKVLPIKLTDSGFDILTETKNISASGAYCSMDKPIALMTKLNIVILIPLKKNNKSDIKKISCEGVVVRVDNTNDKTSHPYRVAIYFNGLKESDVKTLRSCVSAHLKAES